MSSLYAAALMVAALPGPGKMHGMTVSCPMNGQIWGSEAFSDALRELGDVGVDWVSIHPYARIGKDGEVRFRPASSLQYLRSAVQRAQSERVELFWKPHLAYWGSFAWRGEIQFGDDKVRWQRFFRTYRAFILDHARFAEASGIKLFAVGTELDATTVAYEAEWRSLIAEIRKVYSGKITYAANWDQVLSTPFWDAVDFIGVQAYQPLSISKSPPTLDEVHRAWAGALGQIRRLHKETGRTVLLTEIGYPNAPHAARTPWKPESYFGARAPELRARLVEASLQVAENEPAIAGLFWWKWIPGRTSGDFAMQPGPMRSLLRQYWVRSKTKASP